MRGRQGELRVWVHLGASQEEEDMRREGSTGLSVERPAEAHSSGGQRRKQVGARGEQRPEDRASCRTLRLRAEGCNPGAMGLTGFLC